MNQNEIEMQTRSGPVFDPITGQRITSPKEELLARKKIDLMARTMMKGGKNQCEHYKLKKIKYVGIEFEPSKIETCEKEVNDALTQGFEPIRDVETARGLVMVLGLWQQD
tara:strand:+ start:145 stop:474 length:330 start_codon:yes stop_codon:yes gene_type:complete